METNKPSGRERIATIISEFKLQADYDALTLAAYLVNREKESTKIGKYVIQGAITEDSLREQLIKAAIGVGLDRTEAQAAITTGFGINGIVWPGKQHIQSKDYIKVMSMLGYTFRYNQLTDTVEANGEPMNDCLASTIKTRLADFGFGRKANIANLIWETEAKRQPYHPVRTYLESLEWDGKDHIGKLSTYLHSTEGDIHYKDGTKRSVMHTWLLRFLVGAIKKIYNSDDNAMLVLIGPGRAGKDYFSGWLCSGIGVDYHITKEICPKDDEDRQHLTEKFIWLVDELERNTAKGDIPGTKSFMTLKNVIFRRFRAGHSITRPALASFMGTINNKGYNFLADPTGDRRYIIVNLADIDWSYATQIDVNQVWSQAVALYKAGERGTSDMLPEELVMQVEINARYHPQEALEDVINELFIINPTSQAYMVSSEIRQIIIDSHPSALSKEKDPNKDYDLIGTVLTTKFGLHKQRKTPGMAWIGIRRKV